MRIVVDANVLLNFLIYPERSTAVNRLVTRIIAGEFVLVFPPGVADEIRAKVHEKPYFRERVDPALVEDLISLLAEGAFASSAENKAPVESRDPKDQYLLDAAAGHEVEFLITGDGDLLTIAVPPEFPLIVTPAQFLYLIDSTALSDP